MLSNLTVKAKLFITSALLVAVCGTIFAIGQHGLARVDASVATLYEQRFPAGQGDPEPQGRPDGGARLRRDLDQRAGRGEAAQDRRQDRGREANASTRTWPRCSRSTSAPPRRASSNRCARTWEQFKETRDQKIVPAVFGGDTDAALALATGVQATRFGVMVGTIGELTTRSTPRPRRRAKSRARRPSKARTWLLIVAGVGCVVCVLISPAWSRAASCGRVQRVMAYTERLSQGDFSRRLDLGTRDELGRMGEAPGRDGRRDLLGDERNAPADRELQAGPASRCARTRRSSRAPIAELCQSVNEMLDGVVRPIDESASVLARLAAGDLSARRAERVQGDYRRIQDALAETARVLNALLSRPTP
jgi:methyl-accepting chemotaxis protein